MQAGTDGTCIYTDFGGCGFSIFEDSAAFQFHYFLLFFITIYSTEYNMHKKRS